MLRFGIRFMGLALFLGTANASVCAESRLSKALKPIGEGVLSVVSVDHASPADLAVLDGGLRRGLRSGLTCSVMNAGEVVGEVIVAEVSLDRAVALVLGNYDIKPGSEVFINIGR